jgi:acylphosphatase
VGFRWFVSQLARRLGLSGRATNLPDGRVEVVARGDPAALDALDRALAEGPRLARVENVEKADIPHDQINSKGFDTN